MSAPINPIFESIKAIIVKNLNVAPEKVVPEARFNEDLGADSLDTVELVMAFEQEFDCEIPDQDSEKIVTVANAIDYITEYKKN